MLHIKKLGLFILVLFLLAPQVVRGHALNESYIWLNPQADYFDGNVQFRVEELRKFFKYDIPKDTEGAQLELEKRFPEMVKYIQSKVRLETMDGVEIPIDFSKVEILELVDENVGKFAMFSFASKKMEIPSKIRVHSTMLFEFGTFSQCLLLNEYNKFTDETKEGSFYHHILNPNVTFAEIDYNDLKQISFRKKYYLWEGIRHIWIGTDHILFLLALLLPSVLYKRETKAGELVNEDEEGLPEPGQELANQGESEWVPVEGFRGAFWNIFKIVTIFTIAHSITLALASLGIIAGNSRFIESVIAFSIIVVAINNIIPTFRDKTWIVLFIFGLVHGMGFASVMQDLPYRMINLPTLLVCFNVGVEFGQLVIVAAIFPIIFFLRKTPIYKPVILIGGSLVLCGIAGYWFVERAMGWG